MSRDQDTRVVRHFDAPPDCSMAFDLLDDLRAMPPHAATPVGSKPLYLYGAGNLGRLAFDYCRNVGLIVEGVIDKAAACHRRDAAWAGVNLMAPDEVPDAIKGSARLAVSIVNLPWGELETSLTDDGWRDIVPFYTLCVHYRHIHPLDNGWLTGPLSDDDGVGMRAVIANYADDVSRAHHLQFAAWHALQQEWIFAGAPVVIENRYFIPEVMAHLHDHETFVDLGAYHGDVVLRFMKIVNGSFSSILAVEPDQDSMSRLRARLADLPETLRRKISVAEKVLGESDKTASFRAGLGYASRLVDGGGTPVRVHTLDSLGTTPTFIKLHLEASELDVILGGLQTIRRFRPMMALTVYHDRMGLWPIAKRLMDELAGCGYRFYFRLHGWAGTGALIYLIPDAR